MEDVLLLLWPLCLYLVQSLLEFCIVATQQHYPGTFLSKPRSNGEPNTPCGSCNCGSSAGQREYRHLLKLELSMEVLMLAVVPHLFVETVQLFDDFPDAVGAIAS